MIKQLVVVAIITLFGFTGNAAEIQMSARSFPGSGAQGIPTTLILEVSNLTELDVQIPRFFTIVAESPSGVRFSPWEPFESYVEKLSDLYTDQDLTLLPGARRSFEVPLGQLLGSGIFSDKRFYEPGEWRFDLILDSRFTHQSRIPDDPAFVARAARYVVVSEGLDARVWKKIEQVSGSGAIYAVLHHDEAAVSRALLRDAQGSSYEADLRLFASDIRPEEILDMPVRPQILDWALQMDAERSRRAAFREYVDGNPATSRREHDRAVDAFIRARNESVTELARLAAARELAQLREAIEVRFDR